VRETLDNVFRLGTVQALTGPIARGDHVVVAQQVEALGAWDARIAAIYKQLAPSQWNLRAHRARLMRTRSPRSSARSLASRMG